MGIRLPERAFARLPSGLPIAVRIDANRNLAYLRRQFVNENLTGADVLQVGRYDRT